MDSITTLLKELETVFPDADSSFLLQQIQLEISQGEQNIMDRICNKIIEMDYPKKKEEKIVDLTQPNGVHFLHLECQKEKTIQTILEMFPDAEEHFVRQCYDEIAHLHNDPVSSIATRFLEGNYPRKKKPEEKSESNCNTESKVDYYSITTPPSQNYLKLWYKTRQNDTIEKQHVPERNNSYFLFLCCVVLCCTVVFDSWKMNFSVFLHKQFAMSCDDITIVMHLQEEPSNHNSHPVL
jgi:hypothetical protein